MTEKETETAVYQCLSEFRKPLIDSIIQFLNLPVGSNGLDAGCGIGAISKLLAQQVGEKGNVIGLDISKDFLRYADRNYRTPNLQFVEGDINALQFRDESFDWIWSIDTVWIGPHELGCPAEDPARIMKEFYRVLKPGGYLYLLFWSSQKLLPGYPLLEARLNTTNSAIAPFVKGMNPSYHFMNAGGWLQQAGFRDILSKTFPGDISAPLSKNDRNALQIFFEMLWGASESEVSKEDWQKFNAITDPDSEDYLLKSPHYSGFYTYTLFKGVK